MMALVSKTLRSGHTIKISNSLRQECLTEVQAKAYTSFKEEVVLI